MNPDQLTPEQAIAKYGHNSNSFLALYDGFSFFRASDCQGMVAYLETPHAWVGVTEPFSDSAEKPKLLRAFAEAAHKKKKRALLLPFSKEGVSLARTVGFGGLQLGTEPVFDFTTYDPRLDIVPTAKLLHGKGAHVRQIDPQNLSSELKEELDALTEEWLSSRKMAPLGFLNRVEPWTLLQHKRYFTVELKGRLLAFLAAIPIWNQKGWYLIDLLRKTDSPPGATELLLLESMRLLKESGAKMVTLGVAPLSGLILEKEAGVLPRILHHVFEKGNAFYNFKPLYEFKSKFKPTRWEEAYLVYSPSQLTLKTLMGLSEAFFPSGMLASLGEGVRRWIGTSEPDLWIKALLSPEVVVRSVPQSLGRLIYRCRATLFYLGSLIAIFLASTGGKTLLAERAPYFSWTALFERPLSALLGPPFFHWNWAHLATNLILVTAFFGLLEYVAGTTFVLLCAGTAALLGNVLTCIIIHWMCVVFAPGALAAFHQELDVGASLAAFGAAGALTCFFKRGKAWVAILIFATGIICFFEKSLLSLNHATALFLGWAVARFYLRRLA